MNNNMKRHLSYRFMPMIILSYLFINLYLVMTGATWCESDGCSVSKTLLNIEQTDLYSLAIIVFAVLLVLGINILKKGQEKSASTEKLEGLYKFGIFTVMICETILLGYLYLKTGTLCITCFIFYLLVIVNFLMVGKTSRVLVIPFIVVSLSLLDLNQVTSQNESISSKYTLIQSENCKHCQEVKEFLATHKIKYKKVDYTLYSGLLVDLNIKKIPLLIVKNNENDTNSLLILNGVSEIKNYMIEYEVNQELTNTTNAPSTTSTIETISLQEKEGCEIDFLKQDLINCEK